MMVLSSSSIADGLPHILGVLMVPKPLLGGSLSLLCGVLQLPLRKNCFKYMCALGVSMERNILDPFHSEGDFHARVSIWSMNVGATRKRERMSNGTEQRKGKHGTRPSK